MLGLGIGQVIRNYVGWKKKKTEAKNPKEFFLQLIP
jgi:hypothetical protein